MSYKEEIVALEVSIKAVTEQAVLVAYNNEEVWLPRSTLSTVTDRKLDDRDTRTSDDMTIYVAAWCAAERGLI